MAITREQVLHVARLARLDLREDEVARLQEQLSAILEAVSKVSELDLADVPPTSHPLDLVNVLRPDDDCDAVAEHGQGCALPARSPCVPWYLTLLFARFVHARRLGARAVVSK